MMTFRRGCAAVVLATTLLFAGAVTAQDRMFFGIATGDAGSAYYPFGGMLAQLISNKATIGGRKLAATGELSAGAVANAQLLGRNEIESAFVAADVLDAAYAGKTPFDGKPMRNLRALCALYPEHVQLVTTAKSGIRTFKDLKGKAVVAVAGASPLLADLLDAYGMSRRDVAEDAATLVQALDRLRDGGVAAALVVAAAPTGAIAELYEFYDLRIVPLGGPEIDALRRKQAWLGSVQLPAYTYKGQVAPVDTLATMTIWATHANMSNEAAYEVTRALFENVDTLAQVHPKGRDVSLRTALQAVPIPLHPGAERYFREKGLLK